MRLSPFGSIHDSLLPHFDFGSIFVHVFQGALSELLYCKIRIQNSLKCALLIDEQIDDHFVLPVKMLFFNHPLRISK